MHPILEKLGVLITESGKTYDRLEDISDVNRSTLCRLAKRRIPLVSFEIVAKTLRAFGLELKVTKIRYDKPAKEKP